MELVRNGTTESLDTSVVAVSWKATPYGLKWAEKEEELLTLGAVRVENGKITKNFYRVIQTELIDIEAIDYYPEIHAEVLRQSSNVDKILEDFLKFVEDMPLVIDYGLSTGEDFFLEEKIKKIYDKSRVVFDVSGIGAILEKADVEKEDIPLYIEQKINQKRKGITALHEAEDTAGLWLEYIRVLKKQGINNVKQLEVFAESKGKKTPGFSTMDRREYSKVCERKLTERVYERARFIYGDILPIVIKERIKKELEYIVEKWHHFWFLDFAELIEEMNRKGSCIVTCGNICASLVAFLIGLTRINPLSGCGKKDNWSPWKDGLYIPVEMFLGGGEKPLNMVVYVDKENKKELSKRASDWVTDIRDFGFCNWENRIRIEENSTLSLINQLKEVCGICPDDIPLYDEKTIRLLQNVFPGMEFHDFAGFLKVYLHCMGKDTMGRKRKLVKNEFMEFTISSQEELLTELMERGGFDNQLAYKIMKSIRKLKYKDAYRFKMEQAGMEDCIRKCDDISYLPSRADVIEYVRLIFWLGYYGVHYSTEFREIYYSDMESYWMEDIMKNALFKEAQIW